MKLQLDDNNLIIGYTDYGDLNGSIEFTGILPEGFKENFKQNFYLFKDGKIVVNDDYQEPVIADPKPSEAQQQLAQITYKQMMTTQDITAMQTQNAQMAYQLMMMQK